MLAPTAHAFVGDAVHTLFVRSSILESGGATSTLHRAASAYCNAKAQSAVYERLAESGALTPEEAEIARRAKNAHLHSRAKTATSFDYHQATALEAVLGWLYLSGEHERLNQLLALIAELSGLSADKND